jgi:hypothetical protein
MPACLQREPHFRCLYSALLLYSAAPPARGRITSVNDWLTLSAQVITAYSDNLTKRINSLCAPNAQPSDVKTDGSYTYTNFLDGASQGTVTTDFVEPPFSGSACHV